MNNLKTTAKSLLLLFVIALTLFASQTANAQVQTQTPVVANINSAIQGYYESLPLDYNSSSKKYPVIIFLHGIGEIGNGSISQLPRILSNGPTRVIGQGKFPASFNVNGQNFSFIVISPQLNSNARSADVVSTLIDYVVNKYRVDQERIYLTGLSMGGGIVEIYGGGKKDYAARIAALVPVCGNTAARAGNVKNMVDGKLPVKLFHNDGDGTVPSSNSKGWEEQLNAAGISPRTELTIWPVAGHDAWSKAYDPAYKENGKNVYEWMLTQKRGAAAVPAAPTSNQLPVANAGAAQSITLPTSSVTLKGSGTDADGTISSYSWAKVSGPASAAIASASSATTTVSALTQGTYEFELTVSDNKGATAKSKTTVTVAAAPVAANLSPVANAGSAKSINLPTNSVIMDATASDPDGTVASTTWSFVSGPSQFTASNLNDLKSTISNLVAGTYVFQLRVVDNKGAAATSNVTITVNAAVPAKPAAAPAAGDCGCTMTLPRQADGGVYIDASKVGAKPGDVVCIQAGTYPYLNLQNFHGTAAAPITFRNCGGQVIIAGKNYGVSISKSTYFKFDGTGTSGVTYGFKIDGTSNGRTMANGMGISTQSSDFTVNNLEITAVGGAGMMVKTNPTCDPITWGGNFTMRNVVLHDIYIHDVKGEGFYVGSTSSKSTVTCDGVAKEIKTQPIENLKLYNCKTDLTGWDGIQVANVPVNCEVYNNQVSNYGTENKSSQQGGLLFGGLCNGKFYNNIVNKGTGNGIQVFGVGYIVGYNNLVTNAGQDGTATKQDGIYIDDRPVSGYPALYISLANNTVVNPGRSGIRLENSNKSIVSINKFTNNLVVAPGSTNGTEAFLSVRNGAISVALGNKYFSNLADAKFVSSTDFRLQSGSPAINVGVSVLDLNILKDLAGLNRVVGLLTDAGAYEFQNGTTAPANVAPTANAGSDVTIGLPSTSATLNGTGSKDADGTITSYKWTKVSGPSSFTITNASAATTTVTGLAQGVYTFELTVTDEDGATATDRVNITVTAAAQANKAPVAVAGNNVAVTLPTSSVNLNGSASTDDGKIVAYAWLKISGPASYTIENKMGVSTSVSGLSQGVYVFELVVQDETGLMGRDQVTVTVNPNTSKGNQAPVAVAGSNVSITLPASSVTLNGSGSTDDAGITAYAWLKVSGPATANFANKAAATTSVSGLTQGVYVFELAVQDEQGLMSRDQVTVTVNAASVPPSSSVVVSNAGSDITLTLPTNNTTLDGSKSFAASGRKITTYEWTKVNGPAKFNFRAGKSAINPILNLVEGVYEFELKVTDDKGATATDRVKITVKNNITLQATTAGAAQYINGYVTEELKIYPVPVNDILNFSYQSNNAEEKLVVKIVDVTGKVVMTANYSKNGNYYYDQINVGSLKQGVYFFQLDTKKVTNLVQKFIKN